MILLASCRSADGQTLVVSSQDGYCSLITFDPNELGTPYTGEMAKPPVAQAAAQAAAPAVAVQWPAPAPVKPTPPAVPVPAPAVVPEKREAAVAASPKVPVGAGAGGGGETEGAPPKKKAKRAVLTQVTPAAGGMVQTTLKGMGGAPAPPPVAGSSGDVGEEKAADPEVIVVD